MAGKNEARELLVEEVHSALASGQVSQWNVDSLLDQYPVLNRTEKSALIQLRNWAEDRGVREFSPEYAEFSKRRLTGFLRVLSAD